MQQILTALIGRIVDLRAGELRALLWSFAYFFFLLSGYYILRPLRDEMGVQAGVERMQWLFTGTFLAMLLAVPLFGWIVSRFPRRRFVPLVYRFFIFNILIFYLLLNFEVDRVVVAQAFFIWVSLFNLFVVSVFWSFMADLFRNEQARRLFGFIAAGGSAGALLGPSLTAVLAVPLGPVNLLLISALLLEAAAQAIGQLLKEARAWPGPAEPSPARDRRIGGSVFAGVTAVARSPYLLGICFFIFCHTTTATFLYFQQAQIVAGAFDDSAERTRLFATIDLSVGLITILIQLFLTGRLTKRFGVGVALGLLPLVVLLGFAVLGIAPTLGVLLVFQALRRASNFAISNPAREILFTVVPAEQKYKAKNFIDTVVFRGGDAVSGWAYAGLTGLGLGLSAIAFLTLPLAALWLGLALALGRAQERKVGLSTAQA